jgi:hypothetical protein
MGVLHPADLDAMPPGGVPDQALTLLSEVSGMLPLLGAAVLLVAVYGPERLANREVPGREAVGLESRS